MAAAVADARPATTENQKLKKSQYQQIELVSNPDLLEGLGQRKTSQILVGFAAETSLNTAEARRKLIAKGLDLIYLNDVSTGDIFGSDTTQGLILTSEGLEIAVSRGSKATLANQLLDLVRIKLN